MKDLRQMEYFVDMQITVDNQNGKGTIDPTAFVERNLMLFGMESCNSVATPVESGPKMKQVDGGTKRSCSERGLIFVVPSSFSVGSR